MKGAKVDKGLSIFTLPLVPCCLLLLLGCATQASMVDMESEQERTKIQQAQIQERLQAVESYFKDRSTTVQHGQTDIVIKLDQLTTDLQALQGKLEESSHLLAELSQRLDDQTFRTKELTDRLDVLDSQVVSLEKSVSQLTGVAPLEGRRVEPEPSSKEPQPDQTIVIPGRPTQKDKTTGLSPSEAYGLAYNDYLKGNYDLALMGFSNFLTQFKSTSLAANAQYWIGESYYGKKDYANAIEAFQKVIGDYPKSNKVPGAVLKTGYAYIELGDKTNAKAHLRKVIEDYPFSNEANLAKNRLAELK